MQPVSVECSFAENGKIQVRRIRQDDQWMVVEQGRQWLDDDGRHVLVLVGGSRPAELILQRDSLTWIKKGHDAPGVYLV